MGTYGLEKRRRGWMIGVNREDGSSEIRDMQVRYHTLTISISLLACKGSDLIILMICHLEGMI
jgi:hypothetical protein